MDDLTDLKEKYPNKAKKLEKLEKKGKFAEMMLDLKRHPGMQELEQELARRVNTINTKLLYAQPLTENARNVLMAEKDCWLWLSRNFANHEQTLKTINNYLDTLI